MDLGIRGKTALVVGASKGVGRAVALSLAREGCRVVAVARDAVSLQVLEREAGCYPIALDLMAPKSVDGLCSFMALDGLPDIIYHCIGGSVEGIKDWKCPASDWQRVWQFNLGIAVEINRHFVPHMLEKKWGRVVMTSTDGTKCNSGNAPYTSSKFALEGYVKTVSKIWAKDNVILSAVAPGHVNTPGLWMYNQSEEWTKEYMAHHAPIGRWSTPKEIAGVVAFLCSEHASYMAGAIVRVDGGSR